MAAGVIELELILGDPPRPVKIEVIIKPPVDHEDFMPGAAAWAALMELPEPADVEQAAAAYDLAGRYTGLAVSTDMQRLHMKTEDGRRLGLPKSARALVMPPAADAAAEG